VKVQELMERVGINQTGRAIAYIKDGLEEMNLISETNISKGSLVNVGPSNTFSFISKDVEMLTTNNFPTDWTYYEHAAGDDGTPSTFGDDITLTIGGGGQTNVKQGVYQQVTTIPGVTYTFSAKTGASSNAHTKVWIDKAVGYLSLANLSWNKDTEDNTTKSVDFVADHTTTTIHLLAEGDSGQISFINQASITLKPKYNHMHTSSSDINFTNLGFTTSHKLLVDGSTSFDTDENTNTSIGYYIINGVGSNYITISDTTTISSETAGNLITIRGQSINYTDIIKDKRFYLIPSDAIKIKDIKVKNHLNTDDQWRSIPRMVGKPLNTDKDEI
jgi:hypothetical protein